MWIRDGDLEPSHVEDILKKSKHWNIEIAICCVQILSSKQTGQEESENRYRDDLQQSSINTSNNTEK